MYRSILFGLLLCLTLPFYGQQQLRYTQDKSELFDFNTARQAEYMPYGLENFGLNNGTYWFKIMSEKAQNQVLSINSPHIYNATLYGNNGLSIGQNGFSRFPTYALDGTLNYPLFLKVKLQQEAYVPIALENKTVYDAANQKTLFRLGLYYGFGIMVVLINLMCFVLFDEKVFLRYVAFLSAIGLTFFYSDGLFSLFGINGAFINTYLEPILHLSVGLFGAAFSCHFLRTSEHMPKLKIITASLLFGAALFFGLYWINSDYTYASVANALLFGVAFTYLIAGLQLFKSKVYAKIYVIAYTLVFVLATDFYLLKNFGLNFLNIQAVHLKVASVIEMLVLTYAIMYRMRSIKEEKELMSTEMRIYLKRIESLSKGAALVESEEAYLENLINHYGLEATETRLLHYISEGKENHKIARKLNMSEREVEKLTITLYGKLEIAEQIQDDYRILEEQPDYIYN